MDSAKRGTFVETTRLRCKLTTLLGSSAISGRRVTVRLNKLLCALLSGGASKRGREIDRQEENREREPILSCMLEGENIKLFVCKLNARSHTKLARSSLADQRRACMKAPLATAKRVCQASSRWWREKNSNGVA